MHSLETTDQKHREQKFYTIQYLTTVMVINIYLKWANENDIVSGNIKILKGL